MPVTPGLASYSSWPLHADISCANWEDISCASNTTFSRFKHLGPSVARNKAESILTAPRMGQSGQTFRLDGADSTYIFDVNERGELQSLYRGGRLGAQDAVPSAFSEASFPGGPRAQDLLRYFGNKRE